jgi:hypothetical protein
VSRSKLARTCTDSLRFTTFTGVAMTSAALKSSKLTLQIELDVYLMKSCRDARIRIRRLTYLFPLWWTTISESKKGIHLNSHIEW